MPYAYITLREKPQLMNAAAEWFHEKWGVSTDEYLSCMADYLGGKTEYGWYLCLDGGEDSRRHGRYRKRFSRQD